MPVEQTVESDFINFRSGLLATSFFTSTSVTVLSCACWQQGRVKWETMYSAL